MPSPRQFVPTLACRDTKGIVHAVSDFLFRSGCNIIVDEGPVIEQDVARVDHRLSADDLTAVGRDVECVVLARAVRWHVEHRVLMNGHKTVVFR